MTARLNNVYLTEKIQYCDLQNRNKNFFSETLATKREKDQRKKNKIKLLSKYLCVCKIGHDFDILF